MCGIFGFTKFTKEAERMAPFLALAMEQRGGDSYGIAYVTPQKSIKVEKDVGPISVSFYTKNIFSRKVHNTAVIAHTRAASHGRITKENAHPFLFRTGEAIIAGTHNGVITNFSKKFSEDFPKLNVDSEIIWRLLIDKKPLTSIEGWGSCAALVATETEVYSVFFRFNHDALFFVDMPTGGIAYASTEEALETASRFAFGEELETYTIDKGVLYAVDLSSNVSTLVPVAPLLTGVRGTWVQRGKATKVAVASPTYYNTWDDDYNCGATTYWSTKLNKWVNTEPFVPETKQEKPKPATLPAPTTKTSKKCIRCHKKLEKEIYALCPYCMGTINEAILNVIVEASTPAVKTAKN